MALEGVRFCHLRATFPAPAKKGGFPQSWQSPFAPPPGLPAKPTFNIKLLLPSSSSNNKNSLVGKVAVWWRLTELSEI